MSRSRVAPVRSITLPKLELMAAVIATQLASFVIQSLHLTSNDTIVRLWRSHFIGFMTSNRQPQQSHSLPAG